MRLLSAALLLFNAGFAKAQAQDTSPTEPVAQAQSVGEASARAPMPPTPDAFLLVTVNVPGATIVIDETQSVAAPASALRVPAGTHTLSVSAEGYEAFQQSIQVPSEGARVDVFLDGGAALAARMVESDDSYAPRESAVHRKWWFWAAIGGGVVVVAGVIAAIAVASGGGAGQEVIPVPPIPGGP